jgi:hypothetical protein
MRELLEAEGIVFSDDGRVDLKRYGWDPSRDLSEERERILEGAGDVSVGVSVFWLIQLRRSKFVATRGLLPDRLPLSNVHPQPSSNFHALSLDYRSKAHVCVALSNGFGH